MGPYLPLFSIEVEHRFFSERLCPALDFVPTPKTDMVIKKAGLLTRHTINGIRIFYDESRTDSLELYAGDPVEPLRFGFKVFSRDACFENYTHPSVRKEDAILYFDNREVETDTTGKLRLHNAESVSETDFETLNSPLLADILSKKDRLVRPMFIINIGFPESDGKLTTTSKHYFLKFSAKETFWKYYLLGDMARDDLYIDDLDSEIEFESLGVESLANGRIAQAFRSKTTLPLRQRSDRRFQLRDGNSGGRKIVINRLPVASASQVNKEIIAGEKVFVSEMYINY